MECLWHFWLRKHTYSWQVRWCGCEAGDDHIYHLPHQSHNILTSNIIKWPLASNIYRATNDGLDDALPRL